MYKKKHSYLFPNLSSLVCEPALAFSSLTGKKKKINFCCTDKRKKTFWQFLTELLHVTASLIFWLILSGFYGPNNKAQSSNRKLRHQIPQWRRLIVTQPHIQNATRCKWSAETAPWMFVFFCCCFQLISTYVCDVATQLERRRHSRAEFLRPCCFARSRPVADDKNHRRRKTENCKSRLGCY